MKHPLNNFALSIALLSISASGWAQSTAPAAVATTTSSTTSTTSATDNMSSGVVRRVDKEAQKITIKHGDIKNLDMPAMTMVFNVKNPALLGAVKAGDKIRFSADMVDGALTVLSIEPER